LILRLLTTGAILLLVMEESGIYDIYINFSPKTTLYYIIFTNNNDRNPINSEKNDLIKAFEFSDNDKVKVCFDPLKKKLTFK
jgi:hypothetical protein